MARAQGYQLTPTQDVLDPGLQGAGHPICVVHPRLEGDVPGGQERPRIGAITARCKVEQDRAVKALTAHQHVPDQTKPSHRLHGAPHPGGG